MIHSMDFQVFEYVVCVLGLLESGVGLLESRFSHFVEVVG